jgi:hypothetical protein
MTDIAAWILSLGSFAAIVVCTVFAAKNVAGDPARGRRRCQRCWHELGPVTDANNLRCAECGFTCVSEAQTLRTRRHLGRAIVCILAVVAIAVAARVRLFDRGPWGDLPTRIVLWAVPWSSESATRSAIWELAQRVQAKKTSEAHALEALDLFVHGDIDAPAGSTAWRRKYRDLGSALLSHFKSDDPALRVMMQIPPTVHAEAMHGSDAPRVIAIDADVWWPSSVEGRAQIAFADGTIVRANFSPSARFPPLYVDLPQGVQTGDGAELRLAHRPRGAITIDDEGWTECPTTRFAIPAFTPATAITADTWGPIDSLPLRVAISEVFAEGLIVWQQGSPRAGLRFNHRATFIAQCEGVLIGLIVEVCEDGVVRRTSRLWWRGGERQSDARWVPAIEDATALERLYQLDNEVALPDTEAVRPDGASTVNASIPRWTLRIRGDEAIARRAIPAASESDSTRTDPASDGATPTMEYTRWFAGTIELPLRVERMNAMAPARRWRP